MSRCAPAWLSCTLVVVLLLQAALPAFAPPVAFAAAEAPPNVTVTPEPVPPALPAAAPVTTTVAFTPTLPSPPTAAPAPAVAAGNLNLDLSLDPPWAAPGDVVTCTVSAGNPDVALLPALTLTDTLPDGLVYVAQSGQGFTYDADAQRLTWAVGDLVAGAVITGSFQARAQGLALGATITNTVTATSPALAASVTAAASIRIVPPRNDAAWVTPDEGGWLRATDDKVLLRVPPGATAQPRQLRYRAQPAPAGLRAAFALAGDPAGGFDQPAQLWVRRPADAAPRGLDTLRLLVWDAGVGDWQALPTTADAATGSLTTAVFAPGVYAVAGSGPTYGVTLLPSLKAFTSELWSGAAVVGYDLDVPAGPAGLGLNLRLAYNSQGSNILERVAGSAYRAQASWVGLGWDLAGIGSISRPLGKTGPYNLSFGGGAFEIKDVGGVLTTDPQGFLQIAHSGGLAWNTQPWTVRTPDGLQYTFGNPNGAVGGGTAYAAFWTDWGVNCSVRATQWGLTRIADAAGNRWDITWAHELKGVSNGCSGDAGQYTRASYPETLTLTPVGGSATVRVRLVREARADKQICKYNDPYQINTYGDGRLQQVFVEAYTAGAWQLLRRYDLGYTYDSTTLGCGADPGSGNHSLLTAITQVGANGTSALPAYTFGYQGSGNSVRLRTAQNGHGGETQFTYSPQWVANNAGCTSYQWQVVTRQTVTNGSSANGLGLLATTVYTPTGAYAYVTPVGCNNGAEIPRDTYEFLGHTNVLATVLDGAGQAVTQRSHSYTYQYDAAAGQPDPRKGQETLVVTTQPGGSELARTATEWLVGTVNGVAWPYTNAITRTLGGSATAVMRYEYAPANQGGAQYGNVTHVREYVGGATTPYRTTERWYYPRNDTSSYVVNRVAQEKLWDGDAGGACRGQTRHIYDTTGFNQQQTPPTLGLLREVWQARVCDSANQADWVRSAAYSYDSYGNRTGETTANGATTTTAYDTTFKTYPIIQTTTPGAGGGATLTTTNKYYGVNAEAGQGSGLVGQLQSSTDPNGAVTRLTYDAFGRVTAEIRPGDSLEVPTTTYTYYDAEQPFRVVTVVRETSGCSGCNQPTVSFYDGLGRVIQTKVESQNGLEMIVTDTRYHALGLVEHQYVPYKRANAAFGDADFWGFVPLDPAQPHTTTAYDALGRVTLVTAPDNTTTETRYTVEHAPDFTEPRLAVYTIDANRRFVRRASDVFGNLRDVSESTGSWPSGQPDPTWGSKYRTRYTYDVAGRLLAVTDHADNQTTLTYDLLGRKTAMSDPDMGAWSYAYDAAGNLLRQTDAKNQRLCFYYDGLSRLKGKTYATGAAACPADPGSYSVTYGYDSAAGGNKGLGRRTSLTNAAGSVSWTYDAHGRMTSEKRSIYGIGGGTFVTAPTYDSADRVTSVTYPDGEVVSPSYTARGLPNGLSSALGTYASSSTYDAEGRLDLRVYQASGLQTDYVYYPWSTGPGAGGRLWQLRSGVSSGSTGLQNLTYAYDAIGNVARIRDDNNSAQRQCFVYDEFNRLTKAYIGDATCVAITAPVVGNGFYTPEDYGYSANGNLISKTGIGNYTYAAPVSACSAGTAATKPHAVQQAGSNTYSYDCNGNQTGRTVAGVNSTLAYDAENRLTGVSGNAAASFAYDGDGGRIKATVGSGDSASITAYAGRLYEQTTRYQETFDDGLAQGWTAASGAWTVTSSRYQQSATTSNTNSYRALAQDGPLYTRWVVTYTNGTSAGLYLLASAGTGTERGNGYRIWQDATSVKIYENANNVATQRASFAAANVAGQTHSYGVFYDPATGKLQVQRDGVLLGSWTDPTPLTSGAYLSLRTDATSAQFDDVAVSDIVKYYELGGTRIALRKAGAVSYLLGDHLGSTSVAYNASTGVAVTQLYKPWGETRWPTGSSPLPTTYRFTGQREDASLGLYFYGARYYDPLLGRFVQADSIVPSPGDPQSLNRYSYVLNNPLRYVDPSGHDPLDQAWQDEFEQVHHRAPTAEDIQIRLFSIAFPNEWNWSTFYNADGSYITGSLEAVFRDQRPTTRSWKDMPGALEQLAGWYKSGEEAFYTRDVGSLFAGLLNRFEAPEARHAIYNNGGGSARVWVYFNRDGLSSTLMGNSDDDANVHHWAWALTAGAAYGPGGSLINIVRETGQFTGDWRNTWSDVSIGNRGAALGAHFRVLGLADVTRAWNFFMLDRWF